MTEITLFIVTVLFIAAQSIPETRHDYWVIMYQSTNQKLRFPELKYRWKFWGNTHEAAWLIFYVVIVFSFTRSGTVFFWIPILWLIRTILHNGFIALLLDEKFWYLGDTGFDGRMKKMFLGSGAVFLGFEIFILLILIMSYLSVKFNWDFWQMILNIFR